MKTRTVHVDDLGAFGFGQDGSAEVGRGRASRGLGRAFVVQRRIWRDQGGRGFEDRIRSGDVTYKFRCRHNERLPTVAPRHQLRSNIGEPVTPTLAPAWAERGSIRDKIFGLGRPVGGEERPFDVLGPPDWHPRLGGAVTALSGASQQAFFSDVVTPLPHEECPGVPPRKHVCILRRVAGGGPTGRARLRPSHSRHKI